MCDCCTLIKVRWTMSVMVYPGHRPRTTRIRASTYIILVGVLGMEINHSFPVGVHLVECSGTKVGKLLRFRSGPWFKPKMSRELFLALRSMDITGWHWCSYCEPNIGDCNGWWGGRCACTTPHNAYNVNWMGSLEKRENITVETLLQQHWVAKLD